MYKIIAILTVLVALVGCEKKTRIVTELQNFESVQLSKPLGVANYSPLMATGEASFAVSVESFQIPIMDIALGTTDSLSASSDFSNVIYLCGSAEEADCYIELVGTTGENLLPDNANRVQFVEETTYRSVLLGTCVDGSYTALVKASTVFQGNTWYTKSGSSSLTMVEADYSPTEITMTDCENYSVLHQLYTVGERTSYINFYIDLSNIARVVLMQNYPDEQDSSCTWNNDSVQAMPADPVLCITYPNVMGLPKSDDLPLLRRYRLSFSDDFYSTAILLGLYFDANQNPVGGYSRVLYDATYFKTPRNIRFKRAYMDNGNLTVTDFSDQGTDTISTNGGNTIPAFSIFNNTTNVPVVDSSGADAGYTMSVTPLTP